MKTDSGLTAYRHRDMDLPMYGDDADLSMPSLYTKGLLPLCGTCMCKINVVHVHQYYM